MIILTENQLDTIATVIALAITIGVIWLTIATTWIIIKTTIKILKKLFCKKKTTKGLTESKDWLTRSMAKQEIRIQNSLPPLTQKKRVKQIKKRI